MKLWILTEEKPKKEVIRKIIEMSYQEIFKNQQPVYDNQQVNYDNLKIIPIIETNSSNNQLIFKFTYKVIDIKFPYEILIKTVSGNSSFIDFLVFLQENEPNPEKHLFNNNNLLFAIEETKTTDIESRNTAIYQRASKFIFLDYYYPNVKKYMLFNNRTYTENFYKMPSNTNIFGTRLLMTIGVNFIGKNLNDLKKFNTIDEIINFKKNMRTPPLGNVPITINKYDGIIEISGRLSKPAEAGNINHDPNIGALSLIAKALRILGWEKKILITNHGVKQEIVNFVRQKNKFINICKFLDINLENIILPILNPPATYWHYEKSSEKITSIFLHILGEFNNMKEIYQNHAGCERGYFILPDNSSISLPKKDNTGNNLYIPDLILYDQVNNIILLIEGKKLNTLNLGLQDIENYNSIENEFIKVYYRNTEIKRYLTIFGGNIKQFSLTNFEKVLLYISENGEIKLNRNIPNNIFYTLKNSLLKLSSKK
jgi:hypothetical protein